MSLLVVSVSEGDLKGSYFDSFALGSEGVDQLYESLGKIEALEEFAVVSTCLRSEVYCEASEFHASIDLIIDALSGVLDVPREDLIETGKVHYNRGAAEHLYRLSAGIESRIIGESEILGQIKGAMELAREKGTAGPVINRIFQAAIEVGKRARAETGISVGTTSLSSATLRMATKKVAGALGDQKLLLVGAGVLGAEIARSISEVGSTLRITSRTLDSAADLAHRYGGDVAGLNELEDSLEWADIAFFATSARDNLLTVETLVGVMERRNDRELFIFDLGRPRDVDLRVGDLENVVLTDLDEINVYLNSQTRNRFESVGAVEMIIEAALAEFQNISYAKEISPLLSKLYQRAEDIRLSELERYHNRLSALDAAQIEMVERLTQQLVAKILHVPASQLKSHLSSTSAVRLAEDFRTLFDL